MSLSSIIVEQSEFSEKLPLASQSDYQRGTYELRRRGWAWRA